MAAQAKPHEPTTYSGQREMQVLNSWVFKMERYLRITVTKEEQWVDIASTYLEGTANTWYESWYPQVMRNARAAAPEKSQHGVYITWEMFVLNLRQAFQPPNHHEHLRNKWYNLKQTGTVAQYVHEFRELRLQLETSEDEALDKFKRGLKFQTRKEVIIRRPSTVEEAIQIADSHDLAITQDVVTQQSVSIVPVSNTGVQPMELDSIAVGRPAKSLPSLLLWNWRS